VKQNNNDDDTKIIRGSQGKKGRKEGKRKERGRKTEEEEEGLKVERLLQAEVHSLPGPWAKPSQPPLPVPLTCAVSVQCSPS